MRVTQDFNRPLWLAGALALALLGAAAAITTGVGLYAYLGVHKSDVKTARVRDLNERLQLVLLTYLVLRNKEVAP